MAGPWVMPAMMAASEGAMAAAPAVAAGTTAATGAGLAGGLGAATGAIPETMAATNAAGLSGAMVPLSSAPNAAFTLTPLQQMQMALAGVSDTMKPYGQALSNASKAYRGAAMLTQPQQQPQRQPAAARAVAAPKPMQVAQVGERPPTPAEIDAWIKVKSRRRMA